MTPVDNQHVSDPIRDPSGSAAPRLGRPPIYPWSTLQVGDYFDVQALPSRVRNSFNQWKFNHRVNTPGLRLVIHPAWDQPQGTQRVWLLTSKLYEERAMRLADDLIAVGAVSSARALGVGARASKIRLNRFVSTHLIKNHGLRPDPDHVLVCAAPAWSPLMAPFWHWQPVV